MCFIFQEGSCAGPFNPWLVDRLAVSANPSNEGKKKSFHHHQQHFGFDKTVCSQKFNSGFISGFNGEFWITFKRKKKRFAYCECRVSGFVWACADMSRRNVTLVCAFVGIWLSRVIER